MHFRILEAIATSSFLTALECTKFAFGRGAAPDLAEGAYSSFQTPAGLVWHYINREVERRRRGGREGKGGKRKEIPVSAPVFRKCILCYSQNNPSSANITTTIVYRDTKRTVTDRAYTTSAQRLRTLRCIESSSTC